MKKNRTTTTKQEQPVCKGRNITSLEFQKLINNARNTISKNKHQKFESTYRIESKQKLKISYTQVIGPMRTLFPILC